MAAAIAMLCLLTFQKTSALPFCDPDGCYDTTTCISPLVVDTTGGDFKMTSAEDGVVFDILGNGKPMQISWTAPDSGVAFLALDRNGNGVIDNGKELFGSATSQPVSPALNGFAALAEFDKPENGGNGDGIIDQRDAVYSQLLLWIDQNHDGVSQPNELHHLNDLGLSSISLTFRKSRRTDKFGNSFIYFSKTNIEQDRGDAQVHRVMYDVFLTKPD
jgi:hypothetical protein